MDMVPAAIPGIAKLAETRSGGWWRCQTGDTLTNVYRQPHAAIWRTLKKALMLIFSCLGSA